MNLRPDHLRALAATAGLVGRPRLRAGLLLTLAVGCIPEVLDPGGATADDTPGDPSGSTVADPSTGSPPGGSTGTTLTSTGADTLLTDATSLTTVGSTVGSTGDSSTGDSSTGDASTGDSSDTGDSSGSTGGLGDCVDPRTGQTDWACCEAQDWLPHPQCTPWGPPAPPAATADRLRRARQARGRLA